MVISSSIGSITIRTGLPCELPQRWKGLGTHPPPLPRSAPEEPLGLVPNRSQILLFPQGPAPGEGRGLWDSLSWDPCLAENARSLLLAVTPFIQGVASPGAHGTAGLHRLCPAKDLKLLNPIVSEITSASHVQDIKFSAWQLGQRVLQVAWPS